MRSTKPASIKNLSQTSKKSLLKIRENMFEGITNVAFAKVFLVKFIFSLPFTSNAVHSRKFTMRDVLIFILMYVLHTQIRDLELFRLISYSVDSLLTKVIKSLLC